MTNWSSFREAESHQCEPLKVAGKDVHQMLGRTAVIIRQELIHSAAPLISRP